MTLDGDKDIGANFVTSGSTLWATTAASALGDVGQTVALTPTGDVVIAGTYAADVTIGATPLLHDGITSVFVAMISGTDGTVLWARGLAATTNAFAPEVTVDPSSGDVLISGQFEGTLDFGDGLPVTPSGGKAGFVARYDATDGGLAWAQVIPTAGFAARFLVQVFGSTAYVSAVFGGATDFGDGAISPSGAQDTALAAYRLSDGGLMWKRQYGSSGAYFTQRTASLDASGNIIVAGEFLGTMVFGTQTIASTGAEVDAFLVKINGTNGDPIWMKAYTTVGAAITDVATQANDIFITGTGANGIDLGGGYTVSARGSFIGRLSTVGQPLWIQLASGNTTLLSGSIVVTDRVVIAGSFDSTQLTLGTRTVTKSGGRDSFIGALSITDGMPVWLQRFGGSNPSDFTDARGLRIDPVSGRIVIAGDFTNLTQFGDQELISIGAADAYCVSIAPILP